MTTGKFHFYITLLFMAATLASCDDDSFGSSPSQALTFSNDTIRLDTLFATVPSATTSFWAYNKSGDGIRCTSVRQERGNQSGFRVNVDGAYLGPSAGYALSDIELRKNDSIRIFVEATLPKTYNPDPTAIEDNIVFTLENGRQQKVNLNAFAWDAEIMHNPHITRNTVFIGTTLPFVIYGDLEVDKDATLVIEAGATIYFHGNASINVHGRLVCRGTPENPVVLRGDRLDHMFSYLPYDRVSGQWNGIHFYEESYDNVIENTDIHSTYDGIVIDSAAVDHTKLTMENSIVHNCQGYGIKTTNALLKLTNCQITNTLNDCLYADGGNVDINASTLAQFYPFDSQRGAALRISAVSHPLVSFNCRNSIITGYADDCFMAVSDKESDNANNFLFSNCLMRTPEVLTDDSVKFKHVVYEDVSDTISCGRYNFVLVDGDKQQYDFHLKEKAAAIGIADKATMPQTDLSGNKRDDKPDAGAYEFVPAKKEDE